MTLIFALLCLLFTIQLLYPFLTVLAARVFRQHNHPLPLPPAAHLKPGFACIITAYRNAEIAKPLVESLLRQTYPNLVVYLIADECPEFDFNIDNERFVLLKPLEPLRLKAKSIVFAIDHFREAYDFTVVFDADNLAHPKFLEELIPFVHAGFLCIQGQRTAKNLDTTYAALDSMGEHYKNYLEREVPYVLGGSAVISGSGMATETNLYKAYLASPEIEQGKQQWKKMLQEDKILQNFILRQGKRIAYVRQAIVFDEKVETGEAVETQRSRWLFSYFQNVPNALEMLGRGIRGANFNQVYFGFVTLVLPLFIQVAGAGALVLLALFIAPVWSLILTIAGIVFALNILWVLHLDGAPKEVWAALWQVPKFIFRQITALFKMRNPNKNFKHTEHRKMVSVDEVVRMKPEPEEKS